MVGVQLFTVTSGDSFTRVWNTDVKTKMQCPQLAIVVMDDLSKCKMIGTICDGNTVNYNIVNGLCEVMSCDLMNLEAISVIATNNTEVYMDQQGLPAGNIPFEIQMINI